MINTLFCVVVSLREGEKSVVGDSVLGGRSGIVQFESGETNMFRIL